MEHWDLNAIDVEAHHPQVLTSERGGLPELVGADAVVPAEDESAWAAALGGLWRDPGMRLKRGREALVRARERFSADRYLEQLLRLYEGEPSSVSW